MQHLLYCCLTSVLQAGSTSSAGPWSDVVPGLSQQQQQSGSPWQSSMEGGGSGGGANPSTPLAGVSANRGIWTTGALQGALQGLSAANRQAVASAQLLQQMAGPLTAGGMTIWESTHTPQDEQRWDPTQQPQQ
jgi:hypothetical protein